MALLLLTPTTSTTTYFWFPLAVGLIVALVSVTVPAVAHAVSNRRSSHLTEEGTERKQIQSVIEWLVGHKNPDGSDVGDGFIKRYNEYVETTNAKLASLDSSLSTMQEQLDRIERLITANGTHA